MWRGLDSGITKRHKETFEGEGYIHYLDAFTGICIIRNLDCLLQI